MARAGKHHCASFCACIQVGWTPLHAAVNCPAATATTIVELLLASGAAVDARNGVRAQATLRVGGAHVICFGRQNGATGLITAAERGHEAIVRLLLERKADPNAADQVQRPKILSTLIK